MVCTAHFVQWFIDGVAAREKEIRSKIFNSLLASKFQDSLGAQRQKVTFLLEQGLMTKYGWGGYETQEKPRLSTGGRGVQT